jgi:hypothetical protein
VFEEAGYGKQSQRHQRSAAAGDRDATATTEAAAATANPAAADPDLEAFGKLGVRFGEAASARFGRDDDDNTS